MLCKIFALVFNVLNMSIHFEKSYESYSEKLQITVDNNVITYVRLVSDGCDLSL